MRESYNSPAGVYPRATARGRRVGGRQGNYFTMASDMLRLATGLAAVLGHFILEQRFNRALLFDLVKRPATAFPRHP
jgi:hypothetical protein